MTEQYTVMCGKVHVYKRPNSSCWQCSSYLGGKNRPAPAMARPPALSSRPVPHIPQNPAPGVVLSRGIQKALRGDKKAPTPAETGALQMGIGTPSRLCSVLGQNGPAA